MEISIIRQRMREMMERAKRQSAERRARTEDASRAFDSFLSNVAVPLVRQIANVLRADGYLFSVFTPSGSVRLMSDKSAEDFIEIGFDAAADPPRVVGRTSRGRGRRVIDVERTVGSGNPESLSEEDVVAFLLKELEPFVER